MKPFPVPMAIIHLQAGASVRITTLQGGRSRERPPNSTFTVSSCAAEPAGSLFLLIVP